MARETLSRDQIVTAALELLDAVTIWSRVSVSRAMGPTLGHRGLDLN